MSLVAGTRLGPYEIQSAIGAGGMGQVYKAQDTRLGRTVAIKVVTAEGGAAAERRAGFAADADRLRRFEQEARAASQLDHPNILVVHDIGFHEGSPYIVSELLEGEPLRARLGTPLPPRRVVDYAIQIAHGLAAAHEKGIVHRDIKPENLFVTKDGRVKILDFGVAKLTEGGYAVAGGAEAPTVAPVTVPGMVVGTVGYMSPEQVLGKPVDARSDLFSLGVVLYEMLAGQRPFRKDTPPETMTAILREEPPELTATSAAVPPGLDRTVRHCLEKEPSNRFQSARDVAFALEALSIGTTAATGAHKKLASRGTGLLRAAALLCALLLGGLGGIALQRVLPPAPAAPGVRHLAIPVSTWNFDLVGNLAISLDGRVVAFAGRERSREGSRIYTLELAPHDLARPVPEELRGTESGWSPFFSPDGRRVAFWKGDSVFAVDRASTAGPRTICSFTGSGGAWLADGRIVLGGGYQNPGLWEVPEGGGTPRPLYRPAESKGTVFYNDPDVLPGGKGFLFSGYQAGRSTLRVWTAQGGERVLVENAGRGRYLPSGAVVYSKENQICVQPLDIAALVANRPVLSGSPESLAEVDHSPPAPELGWAVSNEGTLVTLPPVSGGRSGIPVWKDRRGAVAALPLKARPYHRIRLGPDGRRFVAELSEGPARRLYLGDTEGEPLTPLTDGPDDVFSTFCRDGRVGFTRSVDGRYNLFRVTADGSNQVERLDDRPEPEGEPEFDRTGTVVLFNSVQPGGDLKVGGQVWRKALPSGPSRPFIASPGEKQKGARFSPDGRWVAYEAFDRGRPNVFVQEYPAGRRVQASVDGGASPMWNPKGGELFYTIGPTVMSVAFADGRVGKPQKLFDAEGPVFDVHPDGNRFLTAGPAGSSSPPPQILVMLNWLEEVTRRRR